MCASAAKQLHDRLLANKPAGAVHDECALCGAGDDTDGRVGMFTAAELATAVRMATADLQRQLDDSVLASTRAADEIERVKAGAVQLAELSRRRTARGAALRAAGIGEEFLVCNLDRLAAMCDEDFATTLDGFHNLSSAPPADSIPTGTAALHAGRESAIGAASPLKDLLSYRARGERVDWGGLRWS
jgi:hypothetical protein